MRVQNAERGDLDSWLALAAEVEPLFGPLVGESSFISALTRNIDRGSALCVREHDGPVGATVQAGMLFSFRPPRHEIGWTAVSRKCRRHGLGMLLLSHALTLVAAPATVVVTTFGPDVAGGASARAFYAKAGFIPSEMTANGPEGGSRQVFRKAIGQELSSHIRTKQSRGI